MDFATLPPEISAALIHSGPGAGSLIEAAAAWDRLGTELEESLPNYASVLSTMTETWQGPSSAATVQAVEPYLVWLGTTAQQCERVASSMQAAAAAFELACRTVVFPVQVTANRTRLAQLIATNWLGTNSVAIAETDAQYEGMWVNNAAAMYRYAATTAQATRLPQFSSPPAIANPAAAAAQAAAAPAAAAPAQSIGQILESIVGTPFGFNPQTGWFGLANTYANQFIAGGIPINLLSYLAQLNTAQALQSVGGDVGQGLAEGESALSAAGADLAAAVRGVGSAAAPAGAIGVGVSMGRLTMPPAAVGMLAAAKTPVQLAAAVSPLPAGESGFPFMPPPMMPPVAPRNKGKREGGKYDDIEIGLEIKGTFMTRPPSAG
ncbi:PPE family protein [Mycobacterium terramassiliense]|uniref:PPE family protein n=1 Tax=Mycobacterium terramassiliense TaxID=1841859 RepID=A0A2U3NAN8_9MYCO|nr:PPE family protein [Mycobacterium terramassiliense]SPM28598.1 PPE family protein [Mycobacterium terramassiliense]